MKRKLYLLIGIGAVLFYSGLIEPFWIAERYHDLVIPGIGSREIKIVHIADVHTTRFGRREAAVVGMIERIDPDYVFVTGDLLRAHSKLSSGLEFLSKLSTKCGVYLVPGNADGVLESGIRRGRMPKDSGNYHVLMNESTDCRNFTLVGIDDPVTGREDLARAFAGVPDSKPVLVMSHFHPDSLLRDLEDRSIDVLFSGHTHGGQIGIGAIVSLVGYAYRSRYMSGLHKINGYNLSVTRGVGTNIFPFRFLCRPEILVFRLKDE